MGTTKVKVGGSFVTKPIKRKVGGAFTTVAYSAIAAGSGSGGLLGGINAGAALDWELTTFIEPAGYPRARITYALGTAAATVEATVDDYLAAGCTPLVVAYLPHNGTMPSQAQAESLGDWATALQGKVVALEYGNEDSYSYSGNSGLGASYATSAKQAYQAIAGKVELWLQCDQYGTWNADMHSSVPDLESYCDGWAIHPYGGDSTGVGLWYPNRIQNDIAALNARGWTTKPLHCTEWGVSSDDGATLNGNYDWPVDMTYSEAATALQEFWDYASSVSRIESAWVYHAHDLYPPGHDNDRETYFGAVKRDGTAKGAFSTKVAELVV